MISDTFQVKRSFGAQAEQQRWRENVHRGNDEPKSADPEQQLRPTQPVSARCTRFDNRRRITAPCGSEAAAYSAVDTSVRSSFALTKASTTATTNTFTVSPRFARHAPS